MAETTTNKATETARAAAASVPQRLAELRDLAAEDPWRAQEETWAWIEDLGKNRRIILVAAAGPLGVRQPGLRSLRQPEVRIRRGLENQIGVLLRKRKRKAPTGKGGPG